MTNPNGAGKIYYTLDGSDPRVFSASEPVEVFTLVDESMSKRVLVPTGPLDEAWKGGAEPFDDSYWNDSTFVSDKAGGVGYDENPNFKQYITYDVEDWMNIDTNVNANTTCYIRITFNLTEAHINKLKVGRNILAIHGLNSSTTSSDFLISVVLEAAKDIGSGGNGQEAGDISTGAIQYNGWPITLNETTRIKARVLVAMPIVPGAD